MTEESPTKYVQVSKKLFRTYVLSGWCVVLHWTFWVGVGGMFHPGPNGWAINAKYKYLEITSMGPRIGLSLVSVIGWLSMVVFFISAAFVASRSENYKLMTNVQKNWFIAAYIAAFVMGIIAFSSGLMIGRILEWEWE